MIICGVCNPNSSPTFYIEWHSVRSDSLDVRHCTVCLRQVVAVHLCLFFNRFILTKWALSAWQTLQAKAILDCPWFWHGGLKVLSTCPIDHCPMWVHDSDIERLWSHFNYRSHSQASGIFFLALVVLPFKLLMPHSFINMNFIVPFFPLCVGTWSPQI